MPPRPKPPPEKELAIVRALSDVLAQLERLTSEIRDVRNAAMLAAKRADGTVEQIADAAGMKRQNAHAALRAAGYEPNAWR